MSGFVLGLDEDDGDVIVTAGLCKVTANQKTRVWGLVTWSGPRRRVPPGMWSNSRTSRTMRWRSTSPCTCTYSTSARAPPGKLMGSVTITGARRQPWCSREYLLWVNLVTDGLPATALSFRSEILLSYITQPNINLFLRYMVIGGCVGSAIVGASSYWFLIDPTGHQMSFWPLTK